MKTNPLPDLNYLKECFELDSTSPSYLKWKKDRPLHHFNSMQSYKTWKWQVSGSQIDLLDEDNYYIVFSCTLNNKKSRYKVHRIIYAIVNDSSDFQNLQVDHIDNNRLNNNPENLRLATATDNQYNRGKQKNNTSGHKNIYIHKKIRHHESWKKFTVKVGYKGKTIGFGSYSTIEEAIQVRDQKIKELAGEFFRI
jgi:hypothetical protein